MFSKPLAFGLLALSCVTAAAGGAYLATRHNAADAVAVRPAATGPAPASATQASPAQPVAETEATVGSGTAASAPKPAEADVKPAAPVTPSAEPAPAASASRRTPSPKPTPARSVSQSRRAEPTRSATTAPQRPLPPAEKSWPSRDGAASAPAQGSDGQQAPASAPVAPAPELPRQAEPQPEPRHTPQFEDLVLPASSVIGLQIQTPLTTERARVEDRVDARVTRDVYVDGRVAIPAGSRVTGSVMFVNRGGKIKDTARLGIRFHTLVLADGTEVRLNTDPIYREGESPAGDSAKKIGGGAVVGAVLGGILGGGKGAVIGGITGAGGGTAAAMAGDRNAATFPSGTIVTARLASPANIQVEKR